MRASDWRQVLYEIHGHGGDKKEDEHRRPARRHAVFMGKPAIEGDGGAQENGETRDDCRSRIVEDRNAELDGEIGHPEQITEDQPARRRARNIVERDGHEGSRQQPSDEQVDCKDELCAAAHVVFRTPCASKS